MRIRCAGPPAQSAGRFFQKTLRHRQPLIQQPDVKAGAAGLLKTAGKAAAAHAGVVRQHIAEFHKDLQPGKGDIVIAKATPSSFVGTDLDAQLKKLGIKDLIVTGLMTHMCVSSTARDAVPLGYQVIIPEDATATRSLATWDNNIVDSKDLQRAALAAVADVFAEIKTTQQVLELPVSR